MGKINNNLNDILETTANKLDIPIEKFNKKVELKSDYKVFKKYARNLRKNLQVSCFHSSRDSKFIHSLKDTPDKFSIENLNGCLNICYQALRTIDSKIKDV